MDFHDVQGPSGRDVSMVYLLHIGSRQEDGKDTMEDKLLDGGRLQELIDELGGESGLSNLIETLGQETGFLQTKMRMMFGSKKNYNTHGFRRTVLYFYGPFQASHRHDKEMVLLHQRGALHQRLLYRYSASGDDVPDALLEEGPV